MPLRFTPPHAQPPGTILSLLRRSYAALVEAEPGCWGRIAPKWAEFDREICAHPFFLPARRAYAACGFRETARRPWDVDPAQAVIDCEMDLG